METLNNKMKNLTVITFVLALIFINIQDSAAQIEDNLTETKNPNTLLSADPNEAGENFGATIFMERFDITTETIGGEIFYVRNEEPLFILKRNTEYSFEILDENSLTISSAKSAVNIKYEEDNTFKITHEKRKNQKVKVYL